MNYEVAAQKIFWDSKTKLLRLGLAFLVTLEGKPADKSSDESYPWCVRYDAKPSVGGIDRAA
ncbi:MAG: hypothetical protein M3120_00490 [Pseudomonadota bacterium]|nr:hypothetical protein [Pseudomonadota bacterium]